MHTTVLFTHSSHRLAVWHTDLLRTILLDDHFNCAHATIWLHTTYRTTLFYWIINRHTTQSTVAYKSNHNIFNLDYMSSRRRYSAYSNLPLTYILHSSQPWPWPKHAQQIQCHTFVTCKFDNRWLSVYNNNEMLIGANIISMVTRDSRGPNFSMKPKWRSASVITHIVPCYSVYFDTNTKHNTVMGEHSINPPGRSHSWILRFSPDPSRWRSASTWPLKPTCLSARRRRKHILRTQ